MQTCPGFILFVCCLFCYCFLFCFCFQFYLCVFFVCLFVCFFGCLFVCFQLSFVLFCLFSFLPYMYSVGPLRSNVHLLLHVLHVVAFLMNIFLEDKQTTWHCTAKGISGSYNFEKEKKKNSANFNLQHVIFQSQTKTRRHSSKKRVKISWK